MSVGETRLDLINKYGDASILKEKRNTLEGRKQFFEVALALALAEGLALSILSIAFLYDSSTGDIGHEFAHDCLNLTWTIVGPIAGVALIAALVFRHRLKHFDEEKLSPADIQEIEKGEKAGIQIAKEKQTSLQGIEGVKIEERAYSRVELDEVFNRDHTLLRYELLRNKRREKIEKWATLSIFVATVIASIVVGAKISSDAQTIPQGITWGTGLVLAGTVGIDLIRRHFFKNRKLTPAQVTELFDREKNWKIQVDKYIQLENTLKDTQNDRNGASNDEL